MTSAVQRDSGIPSTVHQVRVITDPGPHPLRGNPGLVGIPSVIVGLVGLALVTLNILPAGSPAATVITLMIATSAGLFVATVWAALLGMNATASIYGVLYGFYGSYAGLSLGLIHGWFGADSQLASEAVAAWLICWLVTLVALTFMTFRLPLAFTALFAMVDIALALLLVAQLYGGVAYTRAAGAVIVLIILLAIYVWADAMSTETGGRNLPMGNPLLQSHKTAANS